MFAFVFPGQGSQYVGMGKDLYDTFPIAKDIFQEVDETLKQNLSKIIFNGPELDLRLTENAQPALMAVSYAVQQVLAKEFNVPLTKASFIAGHSLGEYSALCSGGVFSLEATARLLKKRGQAMQKAVPVGMGGMVALIGATPDQAQDLVIKTRAAHEKEAFICDIANDNAPGQIVISGHGEAMKTAIDIASDLKIKRAVYLPVSAPFHSSLMGPAAELMELALKEESVRQLPIVPLVSNVTATPLTQIDDVKPRLVDQVTGKVRWVESMTYMINNGVSHVIELGAGKVLSNLMKRIDKSIESSSVESPRDIEDLAKKIG